MNEGQGENLIKGMSAGLGGFGRNRDREIDRDRLDNEFGFGNLIKLNDFRKTKRSLC
jgi:hypothetical protein